MDSDAATIPWPLRGTPALKSKDAPEMQLHELREYCERRGWSIAAEYVDEEISGAKERRPELDRLMQDAKRRRFDAILCWKLDRIGRSLKHLVNLLAELEALGVALISFSDSLDLSRPQGRLMFQIIGAMADFERSLIQERVRAGLHNARSKGKRLGRPRVEVNAERVRELWGAWKSFAEIGMALGISAASAYRSVSAVR